MTAPEVLAVLITLDLTRQCLLVIDGPGDRSPVGF
jgi:hypothetical protein